MTAIPAILITPHAARRMASMNVTPMDVARVLQEPELEYSRTRYGPADRMAQRGRLAVAYRPDAGRTVVLTVLWRTQEEYQR